MLTKMLSSKGIIDAYSKTTTASSCSLFFPDDFFFLFSFFFLCFFSLFFFRMFCQLLLTDFLMELMTISMIEMTKSFNDFFFGKSFFEISWAGFIFQERGTWQTVGSITNCHKNDGNKWFTNSTFPSYWPI